jgi:hypothetical protein
MFSRIATPRRTWPELCRASSWTKKMPSDMSRLRWQSWWQWIIRKYWCERSEVTNQAESFAKEAYNILRRTIVTPKVYMTNKIDISGWIRRASESRSPSWRE